MKEAKKKEATEEGRERLERFERMVVKPVLKPFKAGLMEPVWERTPHLVGGLLAYGVACGLVGAWLGSNSNRGGREHITSIHTTPPPFFSLSSSFLSYSILRKILSTNNEYIEIVLSMI